MSEEEDQLKAITNQNILQDVGVIWPYRVEWDLISYPSKFKTPTLQAFNDTGFLNKHTYYFKSQTRNLVLNDAISVRLFIGIFKGVIF